MRMLIAAIGLIALLAAPVAGQSAMPAVSARPPVEQALTDAGFQGVYAMSVNGQRVEGGAIGSADPTHGFVYEDIFPLASVTKQVVAAMVMQQVDRGKLVLDAPVSRYLPALGAHARRGRSPRSPTLRQLLQHRSGLRNPDDSHADASGTPGFYTSGPTGLSWCLGARGIPGGRWRYNNCDYIVLGAVLARVSGQSLPALYARDIAGPTGIGALFATGAEDDRVDAKWPGGPDAAEQRSIARSEGAGALVGTAEDVLGFDRALMTGQLMSDAARAQMWRSDPQLGSMALGQSVFTARLAGCAKPVRIVERRGGIGRFQARNIILPDAGIALVMLTNRGEDRYDFGEIRQGKGASFAALSAAACS